MRYGREGWSRGGVGREGQSQGGAWRQGRRQYPVKQARGTHQGLGGSITGCRVDLGSGQAGWGNSPVGAGWIEDLAKPEGV